MPTGFKQPLLLVLVAVAVLSPAIGDHVRALATPACQGCAHSSDLPDLKDTADARSAVLWLIITSAHRAG